MNKIKEKFRRTKRNFGAYYIEYLIKFFYFATKIYSISPRRTYNFLMLSHCNREGFCVSPHAKYLLKSPIVEIYWNLMYFLLVNCVHLLNYNEYGLDFLSSCFQSE